MSKKLLWLAFTIGVSIFIVENIVNYRQTRLPCCDLPVEFGVPIALGHIGGFVSVTVIYWPRVFLGSVLAGGLAVFVALMVAKAMATSASR